MTPEQIAEMQKTFAEFKSANDSLIEEQRKNSGLVPELKAKQEALNSALDKLEGKLTLEVDKKNAMEANFKAMEERLALAEARMNQKGSHGQDNPEDLKAEGIKRMRAFEKLLRFGLQDPTQAKNMLTEIERKSLSYGNDVTGGYLAPPEYITEMLMGSVEFSPLRAHARLRQTTQGEVRQPRRLRQASASWTAERITRTETTGPAWGFEAIKVHELYAMTSSTKQDLEDSAFDLMGYIKEDQSEQFGVAEGTAFVSGDNVAKPEGYMTNADVDYTAGGHASEITSDGLISIYHDLREAYLNSAMWTFSRSTLKAIRTLKDAAGQYIWAPGIRSEARPAELLDRGYFISPDMDTIAANAYPVAFGDWRRAYTIVDRIVMEMMIDPYAQKSAGVIEFSSRKRVGGAVVLPEAIRKLKIATS